MLKAKDMTRGKLKLEPRPWPPTVIPGTSLLVAKVTVKAPAKKTIRQMMLNARYMCPHKRLRAIR